MMDIRERFKSVCIKSMLDTRFVGNVLPYFNFKTTGGNQEEGK
jgi:hypothetical protein